MRSGAFLEARMAKWQPQLDAAWRRRRCGYGRCAGATGRPRGVGTGLRLVGGSIETAPTREAARTSVECGQQPVLEAVGVNQPGVSQRIPK